MISYDIPICVFLRSNLLWTLNRLDDKETKWVTDPNFSVMYQHFQVVVWGDFCALCKRLEKVMDWWTHQKQVKATWNNICSVAALFSPSSTFIIPGLLDVQETDGSFAASKAGQKFKPPFAPWWLNKPPSFSNRSNVFAKGDMVSGCFRFRLKLWSDNSQWRSNSKDMADGLRWLVSNSDGMKLWGGSNFIQFDWRSNTKTTTGQLSWKLIV